MTLRRAGAALLVALTAACGPGGDTDDAAPSEDASEVTLEDPAEKTCTGEQDGVAYRLAYPDDWETGVGDDECRFFHPSGEPPADDGPPTASTLAELAVTVTYAPQPFEDARHPAEPDAVEVLDEETLEVDGREALRQEWEHLGDMGPEGTQVTRYVVGVDEDSVLVLGTTSYRSLADDYPTHQQVLAEMVDTLEFVEGG